MTTQSAVLKRTLGRTGIEVTPIGLGVMQFSGGAGLMGLAFRDLPEDRKNAIIQAALEGGINWFDTAEMYGFGNSERSLARALQAAGKRDDEVVIATKWLPLFRTARNLPRTIHNRLRALNPYSIDLYMVHQPWGLSSPEAEMDAMADLVAAGHIRSVGVSNFDVARMRRAHAALEKRGLPLAVNQVHYSLLNRSIESNGLLAAAKELGTTVIAYTPLEHGLLTGQYHQNPALLRQKPLWSRRHLERNLAGSRPLVQALEEIAGSRGVTPGQVALNWLVHFQGETVVAIPGASRVKQAQESAGAMAFRLSETELARLDEVSRAYL